MLVIVPNLLVSDHFRSEMQRISLFRLLSFQTTKVSPLSRSICEPLLVSKWGNRAIQSGNEASVRKSQTSPKQRIKQLSSVNRILEFSLKGKGLDHSSRVAALRRIAQVTSDFKRNGIGNEQFLLHNEKQKAQYNALLDDIGLNVTASNQQDMAFIVWSLARLGVQDPWLVQECEKRVLEFDFKTFSDRQICMVAWGFANATTEKSKPLYEKVREEVIRRGVRGLSDRELSMLLMAFSDPTLKDDRVFGLLEQDILLRHLGACDHVLLMQCVLSFAKAGCRSSRLFGAIGSELMRRELSMFTNRALADTLWSYAKVNTRHRLMQELKQEVAVRPLSKFTTSHLGKITWALAKLKLLTQSDEIFVSVENEILKRDPSFMGEVDIIQIPWYFAQGKVGSNRFFEFFEGELLKRTFSKSPNSHLCQIAWVFSKKNSEASELLEKIWEEVNARGMSKFGQRERMLLVNLHKKSSYSSMSKCKKK